MSPTPSDEISYADTVNIWDEKTNTMRYYNRNDTSRAKTRFVEKYTKIKTLK